jgi:flagellar hook-length control protein FliK
VRGARLDQAAETVEATIRLAAQRGVGHARIALRPAELGGIEIRLRQTAAGLAATVVAEAPEAAQLLQQAAGELRRSLEDQGLQLLRLDVSVADDRTPGRSADPSGQRPDGGDRHRGEEPAEAMTDDELGAEAVPLPNGVLIDVFV